MPMRYEKVTYLIPKIVILALAATFSAILFVLFSYSYGFADFENCYRPSVAVQQEINDINNNINNTQVSLEDNKNKIALIVLDDQSTIDELNNNQETYENACIDFENKRPDIERAIENNYAIFYSKDLLDNVVGNNFLSNVIFSWDVIGMFVNGEDNKAFHDLQNFKEVMDYHNYLCDKNKDNNEKLQKLNEEKNNLVLSLTDLQTNLANKNLELQEMIKLEEKFGKASGDWIFGNGYFAHPCPTGTISSKFGDPRDDKDPGGPIHLGTDFSAPLGDNIYAAADGTVINANYDDPNKSYGLMLEVQHNDGLVTKYFHCSHIYVPIGAQVKKGQNIALVGSTGFATGPHLHFQVELDGIPVDCMPFLQ